MQLQWAFTVVLLLVMVQTWTKNDQPCPKYCVCSKSKFTMNCDGKHGMNYIPKPPNYVRYFQLSNTNLEQMTKASMVNLTNCKVNRIRLQNNIINNISVDALSDLTHLKVLDWRQSYFPMSEFCSALQYVKRYLTRLSIMADNVDTETVQASSFQHFSRLQKLRLSLKKMKTFNTAGLRFLVNLSELDISNNRLSDFSIVDIVPDLRRLALGQNNFNSIPNLCSDTHTPLLPKLAYFSIQDNTIRILETFGLSCLENLHTVILDQNRIEHLQNNSFAYLSALKSLSISLVTSLLHIDELAFNSSSLTELYLTQNSKLNLKKFNPKLLFTHTHLEHLDMSNTKLVLETDDLKDLLLSLKNIKFLRLVKCSIFTLPSGVFCHLTNLTRLILTTNVFGGWDPGVFANVTSIKYIYLDGNSIKTINESSFPLAFRLSVKEVNLAANPFACTCDLLWFRNWMKGVITNRSIVFTGYPNEYVCKYPIYGLPLDEYNPTIESCTIHLPYIVYLVISLSVSIAFTVAALVTYRYRWYILYWISLIRRRRQRQCQDLLAEMRYDGFISYSNPDWDWVSAELMDFLESEIGLRLCEHSRDFKPGMYIVDNVMEAMETSRKTILVISYEYMKSDWCQFELQVALSSFLKKEIDIVVILLEQIKPSEVNSTLRALMVSTTYLEWSDDQEARRLFRDRIQNAMCE